MDFQPTDTRRMLTDTIDRFLTKDYPLADRIVAGNSELGFSPKKYADLTELGLGAALFSEADGGFGGEGFDIMAVFEGLGRGLVNEPFLDLCLLPGAILSACHRGEYLDDLMAGEMKAAFAVYENAADYDWTDVATRADVTQDGWILNGQKTSVKFAGYADQIVVVAKTEGDADLSCFLVPTNTDGVAITSYSTIDGGTASEVSFADVTVSSDALLGSQGQGQTLVQAAIARGIVALTSEALGIMTTIQQLTLDYLRTRKQFGSALGNFQALQHRMADVLVEIEQARSSVINAAAALNGPVDERERMMSAAKYTIGRVGRLVAEESIQMHGGIGMTWDYDLGHFAKRLVMIDHELGDQDYHLMRFAAL